MIGFIGAFTGISAAVADVANAAIPVRTQWCASPASVVFLKTKTVHTFSEVSN